MSLFNNNFNKPGQGMKMSSVSTFTSGPANANNDRGTVMLYGTYIGIVKNVFDPSHMGRVQVFIPEVSGNDPENPNTWIWVSYSSPFLNTTTQGTGKLAPQQSSGFWGTPKDVGMSVLCMFASGDINKGFYIGSIPEAFQNRDIAGGGPEMQPSASPAQSSGTRAPARAAAGSGGEDVPTARLGSVVSNPLTGPRDNPGINTGAGANTSAKEQQALVDLNSDTTLTLPKKDPMPVTSSSWAGA